MNKMDVGRRYDIKAKNWVGVAGVTFKLEDNAEGFVVKNWSEQLYALTTTS